MYLRIFVRFARSENVDVDVAVAVAAHHNGASDLEVVALGALEGLEVLVRRRGVRVRRNVQNEIVPS